MPNIFEFADPIRMVVGRYGPMVYNKHDEYIGKSIELYGEYCEFEIETFRRLINKKDVVWEIGANTGTQAIALSKIVSEGKYIGFEPQIELFKILVSNLTLNGCENAKAMNIALGEHEGYIDLPNLDYHSPYNFGSVSLFGNHVSGSKVEIKKIDRLEWVPAPDFIKIDVEGMEAMVLRGGAGLIRKKTPIMYIENDRVDRSEKLIELLWSMDYDLFWHIGKYFNPDNFFKNSINVFGSTSSINMVCIHKSRNFVFNPKNKILEKTPHPLMA